MEFAVPSTISKLRHLELAVVMPLLEQSQRMLQQMHHGSVQAHEAQAFVGRIHAEIGRINRLAHEPAPEEKLTAEDESEIRRIRARIQDHIRQLEMTAGNITRQSLHN